MHVNEVHVLPRIVFVQPRNKIWCRTACRIPTIDNLCSSAYVSIWKETNDVMKYLFASGTYNSSCRNVQSLEIIWHASVIKPTAHVCLIPYLEIFDVVRFRCEELDHFAHVCFPIWHVCWGEPIWLCYLVELEDFSEFSTQALLRVWLERGEEKKYIISFSVGIWKSLFGCN